MESVTSPKMSTSIIAMTSEARPDAAVRVRWELDNAPAPDLVNVFLPLWGIPNELGRPDVIYLNFGHVNPITFDVHPGTRVSAEDVAAKVAPVTSVARIAVSIERARAIKNQLETFLDAYDDAVKQGND